MKLAVIADDQLQQEFRLKKISDYANVCFAKTLENIPSDTYIVFDLLFDNTLERTFLLKQFLPRPVFINAVNETLADINQPFIRINAWPTFLNRAITELVCLPEQEPLVKDIFKKLGWDYQLVPDIIGMVSARIIGMIINEAYFTLDKKVSTKKQIDIAMKLGTNYPYGPFEWSELIGLKRIHTMLTLLNNRNRSY